MSAPCPACAEIVYRRHKDGCPYCGAKLVPRKGKFVLAAEVGDAMQVYRTFADVLYARYDIILPYRKDSSEWRAQVFMAHELLRTCRAFLHDMHDRAIGVEQFAVRYVKTVLESRSGAWVAENPTLAKLRGGTFVNYSAQAFNSLRDEMRQQKAEARFAVREEERLDGMMRLG